MQQAFNDIRRAIDRALPRSERFVLILTLEAAGRSRVDVIQCGSFAQAVENLDKAKTAILLAMDWVDYGFSNDDQCIRFELDNDRTCTLQIATA
jgi:hypothetical protein